MLAEHALEITATCPVDGRPDHYECRIRSGRVIPVEQILKVAESFASRKIYQEELTVELSRALSAKVETIGYHSGVKTTVWAGGRW